MNIKQACERVSELQRLIEETENIVTMLKRRNAGDDDVHIDVWNAAGSLNETQRTRRTMLPRCIMIEAAAEAVERHKQEISRLKPVIDMANAALKGVGA
ncbi:hypothetical protein [Castellaniella caeni]|uniref:hypothetical protein n=1 Tax=Castellaniella caeni TaxID=266123 RepID=UPI000C9FED4D|nr:hypothetical protein [Castellaniella caeni]